jgi:hypothetical protein
MLLPFDDNVNAFKQMKKMYANSESIKHDFSFNYNGVAVSNYGFNIIDSLTKLGLECDDLIDNSPLKSKKRDRDREFAESLINNTFD